MPHSNQRSTARFAGNSIHSVVFPFPIRGHLQPLAVSVACLIFGCAAPVAADTISTLESSVKVETLAKLDHPWGMEFLPDGRLLITEKPGRLRLYSDGQLSPPLAGVPSVEHKDQGGLLDVAVDPDFARNGFVYLSYTEAAEEQE